ncbi:nucleotidyltransferase domain-containing protein [Candidatus Uhrbacteria bacterium]|nr:nucleotidyltransferase domain-containing protein [Candidatus Uhrbacteria bacterium]
MPLHIHPEHLDGVKKILRQIIPRHRVAVFGSRATGTARPSSDLDLFVYGTDPLDTETTTNLKMAFSESNLPFFVDIVEESGIEQDFRDAIEKQLVDILP